MWLRRRRKKVNLIRNSLWYDKRVVYDKAKPDTIKPIDANSTK